MREKVKYFYVPVKFKSKAVLWWFIYIQKKNTSKSWSAKTGRSTKISHILGKGDFDLGVLFFKKIYTLVGYKEIM